MLDVLFHMKIFCKAEMHHCGRTCVALHATNDTKEVSSGQVLACRQENGQESGYRGVPESIMYVGIQASSIGKHVRVSR